MFAGPAVTRPEVVSKRLLRMTAESIQPLLHLARV